jgi:hypothetical protein
VKIEVDASSTSGRGPETGKLRNQGLSLRDHPARPDNHALRDRKAELDKAFEERDQINAAVVKSVDEASDAWGVKVSRYEIQNINIPQMILQSMEVQTQGGAGERGGR